MAPQLIFGTATFGMNPPSFPDAQSVRELFATLKSLDINHLDTAARYPPLNPGRSEELIGEVGDLSADFSVDTKLYTDTATDGSGDLSKEKMEESAVKSLGRLKRTGVNVLHAHSADPSTPFEEQIRGFNEQIEKGRCKAWGVSNIPPAMLEKMLQLCDENGWQKPSCYQGDYSLITRGMETKLLPILRAHGMSFNAFRPLSAGFLSGKFINNQHSGTRFDGPLGPAMQRLFGAEILVDAVRKFDAGIKNHGLTSAEAAFRWIAHHSALGEKDGIILGASKPQQIVEAVGFIRKGPLPAEVVELAQETWDAVKDVRAEII